LWSGLGLLVRSRIDGWQDFLPNKERDRIEIWTCTYSGFFWAIPMGAVGFVVDSKRVGRFISFMMILTICIAGSLVFMLTELNTVVTAISYSQMAHFALPAAFSISFLFCYEFVPLKYRLVALLSLTCVETFGKMMTGLADKMRDPENNEDLDNRNQILIIVPIVFIGLAIIVALWAVRRDTPLSMVSCRNKATTAYDQLVQLGNTAEPIPMSREEFEINSEKEIEALGSLNHFFGSIKKCLWGPIGVLLGVAFIDACFEQVFERYYYWYTSDHLGKGYMHDFLPMFILDHSLALGGMIACIGLYLWVKDIRFVAPTALLIATLGGVICASVDVIAKDGFPRDMEDIVGSMARITTGVVMLVFGRYVYTAVFKILTMDLFTTKTRGRGIFVNRAIQIFMVSLIGSLTEELKTKRSYMIILAVIAAGISALIFALFYTTQWFEKSLICRDPELDAGWLISNSQLQQTTVLGSRDKAPVTSGVPVERSSTMSRF